MSNLTNNPRAVAFWLFSCALLVACMVVIGGYTRLSGSGLSITQWKPVYGTLPPMSAPAWQEEFAAYQHSPQYEKINSGMSLDDFKSIYWPEYIHRLLGRMIGVVFLLPLLIFAACRSIAPRLGWRLAGIFALGGLQGLIGWLMVASGLVDNPSVSPIRLMLHLVTALAIFGLLLWTVMEVVASDKSRESRVESREESAVHDSSHSTLATYSLWFLLLCLQLALGALMAGFHTGLAFNTWPTMNGQWLPEGLGSDPVATIQFLHRNVAVILAMGFLFWWYYFRAHVNNMHLGKVLAVAAALALQFTLGVLTLIHQAPLELALLHQVAAVFLLAASLRLLYGLVHD